MMLQHDWEEFGKRFPTAESFMLAGQLRHECYILAREMRYPHSLDVRRQKWGSARLKELLLVPCCREPWFVATLRGDSPLADQYLFGAGL